MLARLGTQVVNPVGDHEGEDGEDRDEEEKEHVALPGHGAYLLGEPFARCCKKRRPFFLDGVGEKVKLTRVSHN